MADIFGDLGTAVGDLFGAAGANASAKAYKKAAQIAQQNEQLTETSTKIQQAQQQRQAYQVIGSQQAEVAAAGFNESGSALDILRSSREQASLASGLINIQGAVTAGGFASQAASYAGQAAAEQKAAGGGLFGGILSGLGAIASIF